MLQSLPRYSAVPEMTQFSCITLSKIANSQQHGSCKEHREWGEGKENTQSIMPEWQRESHLPSCWIITAMIVLNLKQLKERMKVYPHFHIPTHAIDLPRWLQTRDITSLCSHSPLAPHILSLLKMQRLLELVSVWVLYAQQDFHRNSTISSYSSFQECETVTFLMLFDLVMCSGTFL